jgi:UDP-N-acetylglucosamine 4,6-dehydratase
MLITGGTGSFGQVFVRRLLDDGHERICIYSRDEYKQALMREKFNDDRLRFFIGDVRDRDRLRRAMEGVDVVVHAAALKRIEVCDYSPIEAMKTNVIGSSNVIEAAYDAGAKKVVALSTDKAADPKNLYGASKLFAEKLFLASNQMYNGHGTTYSCVRYGNVWNSNGSVVPAWNRILEKSDTVPVTNPECTRYFMYLDEAVDLVLSTINNMKGGELNMPTLPAYRIGDLAEAMGAKMNITGLHSREKLHETMDGITHSDTARRMTITELQDALERI